MPRQVKVAISTDFLTAFARLPQAQQNKAAKFITNFQRDPTSSGLNYEKIRHARDPNMHSVRLDQAYRAVVLKPETGNVYMLLWVARHDDAYDWAQRHRCSVNPETGAVQVYEVESGEVPAASMAPQESALPSAFEDLRDKELVQLGVPEALIPLVRNVRSELELDAIEHRVPIEAYEGLFLYMAGTPIDKILNERMATAEPVDTGDFAAALERVESRSRFAVVEDDLELAAMLNAPLDKWRVFLHPSQRLLVEGTKNGPVRVLGGAGTGKTVVAMHRARWLAGHADREGQRILFTTFTKNLATDIETNLRSICAPAQMARIEVVNLDAWVVRFLRKRKYEYDIVFGSDTQKYWEKALDLKPLELDLSDAFYREEWQRVVQPQGVESVEQYKRASRVGRGTRLNRAERTKIWPVFEEYRNQLALARRREVDDAYRDAASLLANDSMPPPYSSVIVDEAQDMSPQAFRLLRALVAEGSNDMFIVGDGHQRIYSRNQVVLSQCGINIRGRSRKLRVNYRTTEEIRRWAVRLLEGYSIDDLDGGVDTNGGYKSLTHGEPPEVHILNSADDQLGFISGYLEKINNDGGPPSHTCIVARTKRELDGLQHALETRGVAVYRIDPGASDSGSEDAVRLATMHRVKGLEFDYIIAASVNEGLIPLEQRMAQRGDAVEARQADLEERALMYVTVTRAKKNAVILSYGKPSPYLRAGEGAD